MVIYQIFETTDIKGYTALRGNDLWKKTSNFSFKVKSRKTYWGHLLKGNNVVLFEIKL